MDQPTINCSAESAGGGELFSPPWIYRNGHVQTLAGMYLYSDRARGRGSEGGISTTGQVQLPDGDRLVFQDDAPAGWRTGDRSALLLHGLCGSHASPYMIRIARRLRSQNVRTFRLDWRGCGAGAGLARFPYHSGRSEDVVAMVREIESRCPDSPVSLIGFSLGGNVALKLLGENRESTPPVSMIDRAVAVSPPIDLRFSVLAMQTGWAKVYDRYFCRTCLRDVGLRRKQRPDALLPSDWNSRRPRTLYEFDDAYTAPVCGFSSADDYYSQSNSKQFLHNIGVPTLIIAAHDDPLIPFKQFRDADYSSSTHLVAPRHGGHLGFCTFRGQHWLDRQVTAWAVGPGNSQR
ncbi:YheT family hydrolase [Planctomicrobium sp. SH661]|uniref:YheT family hydrolase n=1 Tax=Planctomicrobium sp. SH661 TaxID=3448124 RepID=UPI003F5B581E